MASNREFLKTAELLTPGNSLIMITRLEPPRAVIIGYVVEHGVRRKVISDGFDDMALATQTFLNHVQASLPTTEDLSMTGHTG